MHYPCSQFCADVKFDIRSDNRFDIKVGDSFHVNHTIKMVANLDLTVQFNMEAIQKSDIKSDIRFGNRFDIRIKQTTWIGHKGYF